MELSLKELCLNKLGGMSIRRIKYELSEGKAPIELISLVCLRIIELRVFEKHPGKIYRIVCEICKEDLTMVKENLSIVKRGDYIYILAKSGYSLTLSLWRNGRCFRQPFQYKTVARGSNKSNYLNIIGSNRSVYNPNFKVFFRLNKTKTNIITTEYNEKRHWKDELGFDWKTLEIFPPEI